MARSPRSVDPRRPVLRFEPLEDRTAPAVITVSTTADLADGTTSSIAALIASPGADGVISLREAITAANNTAGADTIEFDIGTGGVQTISVGTALPTITQSVTIDGTTQEGYTSAPVIEVRWVGTGTVSAFTVSSPGVTIRGLSVTAFTNAGVSAAGSGLVVEGNYIGLAPDGVTARGNSGAGVLVGVATGVTIQNNVIAANTGTAVGLGFGGAATANATITGNKIGTTADGTAARLNGGGINLGGAGGHTLRGNQIVGGVSVTGSNNTVAGNRIGTNADGTARLGNGGSVGVNVTAQDNTIGGPTEADRNVITDGVNVSGNSVARNTVQGNYIGTNAAGTARLYTGAGTLVTVDGPVADTTVRGNVIAGSVLIRRNGVGTAQTNTVLAGNFIGVAADETTSLTPAGTGVSVQSVAGGLLTGTVIGGSNAADRNVIAEFGAGTTTGAVTISAAGVTVQNNHIGTATVDTPAVGNAGIGIYLTAANAQILDNVVGNSGGIGISIFTPTSTGVIAGNKIGTDPTGTIARPNERGIGLGDNGFASTVTGDLEIRDNLISGNKNWGVFSRVTTGRPVFVRNNSIGTNIDGTGKLDRVLPDGTIERNVVSNGADGVYLQFGAPSGVVVENNTIAWNGQDGVEILDSGGNRVTGNTIRDNAGVGVRVTGPASAGNRLSANVISGNTGGAIVLAGGNANAPTPTNIQFLPGNPVRVTGDLPVGTYTLELFTAATAAGGAEQFLAQVTATSDGSFVADLPAGVVPSGWVSLTATDAAGNTSPLSAAVLADAPPTASAGGPYTVPEGGTVALDATASSDDSTPLAQLQFAWDLDDDGEFDDATGPTPTFSAAGLDGPTARNVRVRVTDGFGNQSVASAPVTVENVAPIVSASGPTAAVPYEPLAFAAAFADPGIPDTHEVRWDFGDGTVIDFRPATAAALSPAHTYSALGTLTPRVTIRDDDGGETTFELPAVVVTGSRIDGGVWYLGVGDLIPENQFEIIATATPGTFTVRVNGSAPVTAAASAFRLFGSEFSVGYVRVTGTAAADTFVLMQNELDGPFRSTLSVNSTPMITTARHRHVLSGLGGNDTFDLSEAPLASSANDRVVSGGAGNDILIGPRMPLGSVGGGWQWYVTGLNTGYAFGNTELAFDGVENLIGSDASDAFFVGSESGDPRLTGRIDGRGGDDIMYLGSPGTPVAVNLRTGGATLTGGVQNIENFIAWEGSGTVIGANAESTWTVRPTGPESGFPNETEVTVSGVRFIGFDNLTGGSAADRFVFEPTTFDRDASIRLGSISGGGGADTLDFSPMSGWLDVDLQARTARGQGGGLAGSTVFEVEQFTSLEAVLGTHTTQVYGLDAGGTWSINADGSVTHAGVNLRRLDSLDNQAFDLFGRAGIDTLAAAGTTPRTWELGSRGRGNVAGYVFSGFENLTGGGGADTFLVYSNWSLPGTLNGGGGTDTLDYSFLTTPVGVDLQAGTATGVGQLTSVERVFGGGSFDSVTGRDTGGTWALAEDGSVRYGGVTFFDFEGLSAGAGTDSLTANFAEDRVWTLINPGLGEVAGYEFSGFENLTGGAGADTFVIETVGSVSGTIAGGGGPDTLDFSNRFLPVTIDLAAGTASATGGFTSIETLVGTASNDTVIGRNANGTWTLDPGVVTYGPTTLIGFESLVGGSAADTFRLNAPGLLYAVAGGGGTDALYSPPEVASAWQVTGVDAGEVGAVAFAGVERLFGGLIGDQFVVGPNGSVSGEVNGQSGRDVLDLTAVADPATVDLTAGTATGVARFVSVEEFRASGSGAFRGSNAATTWQLTGSGTGTAGTTGFTGFAEVIGGTGSDTFRLAPAAAFTRVDGGEGLDALDYAQFTSGVTVNLTAGTATAAGMVAGFETVIGGIGADVLVGSAEADVLRGGGGDDLILGMGGDDTLAGDAGRDILVGGGGGDSLNGGGGEDLLIGGRLTWVDEATGTIDWASLGGLRAEWVRTDATYEERVARLGGQPGGLNGDARLDATTVLDDGAADTLLGGSNRDWFVIHVGVAPDLTPDRAGNEGTLSLE